MLVLLGFGELSAETLGQILEEVAGQAVEADAVEFDVDSLRIEPIRPEDDYGGWRTTTPARIGAARLTVHVDVGIGDAMTPALEWLDYLGWLDLPQPRLRALAREGAVDPGRLGEAMTATFSRRRPSGERSSPGTDLMRSSWAKSSWKCVDSCSSPCVWRESGQAARSELGRTVDL